MALISFCFLSMAQGYSHDSWVQMEKDDGANTGDVALLGYQLVVVKKILELYSKFCKSLFFQILSYGGSFTVSQLLEVVHTRHTNIRLEHTSTCLLVVGQKYTICYVVLVQYYYTYTSIMFGKQDLLYALDGFSNTLLTIQSSGFT